MSESHAGMVSSRRLMLGAAQTRPRIWCAGWMRSRGATTFSRLSDDELRLQIRTPDLPKQSRHAGICEAMRRVFGAPPSLREQRVAHMLLSGRAVEAPPRPALGPAVALTAVHLGLAGRNCHVLSSNRLALELADTLGPFLDFAGVGWGRLGPFDPGPRRVGLHRKPVLFAMLQEIALDLLRERNCLRRSPLRNLLSHTGVAGASGPQNLSGALDFALVLDGEATLCRKALTTMVGSAEDAETVWNGLLPEQALGIAAQLRAPRDFELEAERVALTNDGRERLRVLSTCLGPAWENPARAELTVRHALEAIYVWRRDVHYRVEDGVLALDDFMLRRCAEESVGVPGPDIFIAVKEGLGDGHGGEKVDRMSLRLAVLRYSERAALVTNLGLHARELRKVYGLGIGERGPRHKPDAVFMDLAELSRALRHRDDHRPVTPLLLGGDADQAAVVAARLACAAPPIVPPDSSLEDAAAREGIKRTGACLWLGTSQGADLSCLEYASGAPRPVILIAIGSRWFPELPEAVPVWRVQLADVCLLTEKPPQWLRLLAWLVRFRFPGARQAFGMAVHAQFKAENAAEVALRRRLHEFDRACMRAVSFLCARYDEE